MTVEQASRRYFQVFVPAMIIYVATTFGIHWLDGRIDLALSVKLGLSLVAVAALLSVFWVHWRFMNEIDEFLREIQVKAVLGGLVVVMLIASGWGSLESLLDAPQFKVFWLTPVFWISYSATAGYLTWRDGGVA